MPKIINLWSDKKHPFCSSAATVFLEAEAELTDVMVIVGPCLEASQALLQLLTPAESGLSKVCFYF